MLIIVFVTLTIISFTYVVLKYFYCHKTHFITLNTPWYEHVLSGRKRYEGRRYFGRVKSYKVGDTVVIKHHTDVTKASYQMKISNIQLFKSFEHALTVFYATNTIDLILPNITSIQDGIEIYKKYVSIPTQIRDGVSIIQLDYR